MKRDEVLNKTKEYFNGDELASGVWVDKYSLKDKEGDIKELIPDDMHRRIAKEFARIEKKYKNPLSEEEIYNLFKGFKYIVPQGSPMFGIGNPYSLTSLSNCFVIGNNDNADSYGGVLRTDEEQVQLMKRRGGVGHDLSHLRPSGSTANNAILSGMAGSVLYAHRYSNSTKEVRQGDRRGALMLSMSIEHPDAERFIDSKLDKVSITDANISVRITDSFMKAVINNEDFIQVFPVGHKLCMNPAYLREIEFDKLYIVPNTKDISLYIKKINARRLWNKIIHNAWESAEPGVLFWDKILSESPADCYPGFKTISTNPCAELPLSQYDSCRLVVLNLYSYVDNPFKDDAIFNMDLFIHHVKIAQRLMDDLVDLEIEKINGIIDKIKSDPESDDIKRVELGMWERILQNAIMGRRTGLGITAEGDMLAALNITYGTNRAIDVSEDIHKNMAVASYSSSINLAKERGAFPIWDSNLEKDNEFVIRIKNCLNVNILDDYYKYGRRNISNLTIAPTGSTSILTQTTSGIEPCFSVYYKRRRRVADKEQATFIDVNGEMFCDYNVFHHKFIEWYDRNWYKVNLRLFGSSDRKKLETYTTQELEQLIALSPYFKSTAKDVDWIQKVKLQGEVQKWVDHSISATTNIPKETPESVVSDIYMTAYNSGCKGMTIYREGSRSGILLNEEPLKFTYIDASERPRELNCDIYHKVALKRNWMILVGLLDNKPYEIFAFTELPNHIFPIKIEKGVITKVKSGVYSLIGADDNNKSYEVSNIIPLIEESEQVGTRKFSLMLRHHIDPKWIVRDIQEYSIITSFDKVIERVLKNYIDKVVVKCPQCGSELVMEDGCTKCLSCGFSRCG